MEIEGKQSVEKKHSMNLFDRELEEKTAYIDKVLKRYLPKEEGWQKTVIEAMNYSMTAGGKRLRPMLMREVYLMCGGEEDSVTAPFMAAIEMIHTYSLVHDDLPAMDNDEYRRGQKTTWRVYGDAMGILAGDGLLNYAFETALCALKSGGCTKQCGCGEEGFCCQGDCGDCQEECTCCQGEEEREISAAERLGHMERASEALSVLARKAGIYGMIGGQTADVMSEEQTGAVTEEQIMFIHEHKTAALIQAAMMIGAILAGASKEQISRIEKCAYNVGLAFQIQDDILDVTGNSHELGKPVGSDDRNHKQTYVSWKGLAKSQADVEALSKEAVSILDEFAGEHEFLEMLILKLIHRKA